LPNKPCLPPTNVNESKDLKTPLSSLLFLFRGAEKKDGKHSPSSAALYMLGRCEEKVQIDSAFRPKAGSCQCVRSLGLGLRWEETWLRRTERERGEPPVPFAAQTRTRAVSAPSLPAAVLPAVQHRRRTSGVERPSRRASKRAACAPAQFILTKSVTGWTHSSCPDSQPSRSLRIGAGIRLLPSGCPGLPLAPSKPGVSLVYPSPGSTGSYCGAAAASDRSGRPGLPASQTPSRSPSNWQQVMHCHCTRGPRRDRDSDVR
jgi:hypothetical protein